MNKPIHRWSAREIAQAVARRELSAVAVVRALLERVFEREPMVQAFAHLDPDLALAAARRVDAATDRGPLAGVPFGAKDIIDTADLPTEYGTPIHAGHRPARDAACVALSRRAGAILLGKTVTTEFANFHPGKTRNPHDPARTPGGSSSGSGAAVGDGMVPLALGTQTTASVIRPASFCGVFGYRPSYGDIRVAGVMEASGSLDTLGILARSVDDIALYREVLVGNRVPAPVAARDTPPRIGLCRTHLWSKVEPSSQALLEAAAASLARAGAAVEEVELPPQFADIAAIHRAISSYEFARNFAWEIEHHWTRISATLREGRLAAGLACTVEQYREALARAAQLRALIAPVFGRFDALLTPAVIGEAPIGLDATGDASMCLIWTTLHGPALTLPVFTGPQRLPVGAQLVAAPGQDRALFATADWVYRRLTS